MNDECERIWKEVVTNCLNLLSRKKPGGTKEKSLKTSGPYVSRPRFQLGTI
jgi:hypothetical protein